MPYSFAKSRRSVNSFGHIQPGLAGLTNEQIQAAQAEAAKQKMSLHQSILKLGFLQEQALLEAVAQSSGLEVIDLTAQTVSADALAMVSPKVAIHYHIVPVKVEDGVLWIATSDPSNKELENELNLILGSDLQIQFLLAHSESIRTTIRKFYGVGAETVEQMVAAEGITEQVSDTKELADENKAHDASVIKLVNQILADAIDAEATDIHFEPYEDSLRIRYRTDGVLHDSGVPATAHYFREGITSRIKIMAGLDIAEKRLPQDGRAQVNLAGLQYDLRISVLPTRHREAVNIRILPRGSRVLDLVNLGIPDRDVAALHRVIQKPHGIVLVTGPTGSGKTTTLYTCMKLLNRIDKKILTVEDPVEYNMAGLVQMQVQPEISFTFARALRSMLRHDPDIILVGEIRDLETAETAIRTALTGHLVFSTLHTNNASSAITRLLDMGIEPYLAASSIEAILAQRLVRMICSDCKAPYVLEPEIATAVKSLMDLNELPATYHGVGCSKCRFSGYQGRTVITELMLMSEEIRQLTIQRCHAKKIENQACREGMKTLFASGIDKVHQEISTYEEILRVTTGNIMLEK